MIKFDQKVLIMGYGAVSKCFIPLFFKHVDVPFNKVTVLDFEDKKEAIKEWTKKGLTFVQVLLTRDNLTKEISKYVSKGGLLIDLAWNIEVTEMVQWCHENTVMYVNASIEEWDPKEGMTEKDSYDKSLYCRHIRLRKLIAGWASDKYEKVTALMDMGANPGLISSFARQGLVDIAKRIIKDKKYDEKGCKELEQLIAAKKYNELAMKCNIKVVHCSEIDTQISKIPKEFNEFVGTWSIEGFREEGTSPAEMGWGTHEKKLPKLAIVPTVGPKNVIFIEKMGLNTWVRSFVPNQEIIGMVIRHGEAVGISDRWSVYDKDGKCIYRPTVHYAYHPCQDSISSIHELRCRDYKMQDKMRILGDDIIKGEDILGALLMGHPFNAWWCGSMLDINEARRLAPGQNATTLQVVAGLLGGITYIVQHQRLGVILPDDVPYEEVLKVAKPYLGKFVSEAFDWTPLKNRTVYFKNNEESKCDESDPFQFHNFEFIQ